MTTTISQLAELLAQNGLLASSENHADAAGLGARPAPSADASQTRCATMTEPAITGADCDSRVVRPGHLFVCKGAAFKPAYLASALEKGAVAYLCDETRAPELAQAAPGVPALVATDAGLRRAMALVSAEAWCHPDRELETVGITGTKGKSTTSYIVRAILDAASFPGRAGKDGDGGPTAVGLVGSIETFDGRERAESINTTPESCDLWRHIANMRDSGLSYLVTEVSSQALKYDRVAGLGLDVAAFLNIGYDHISPIEHPTWEDYFTSKLKIFSMARDAVVNLESEHLEEILAAAGSCEKVLAFSSKGPESHGHEAQVWAEAVTSTLGQSRFTVHTPSWSGPVTLSMAGSFNVDNALAAIAICELLGVGQEAVTQGLAHVSVPGRMELITSADRRVAGIVDFAHNQMSFATFGPSMKKEFPGYQVISVFGATGDKAIDRRGELPVEAAKWSDLLIFTEDDPGHERVEDICAALQEATPAGTPTEVVPDRHEAIEHAVDLAFASDRPTVVCVLARGTEGVQHREKLVPFPLDMDMLRAAFARHEQEG